MSLVFVSRYSNFPKFPRYNYQRAQMQRQSGKTPTLT
jgi:hypothetical protein